VQRQPGVNFTNIIRAAFPRADPKSAKNNVKLSVFFVLLGSAHIKAACKMLMKLTTGEAEPHPDKTGFHRPRRSKPNPDKN